MSEYDETHNERSARKLIADLRAHSPIYDGAELVCDIGPTALETEAADFIEWMLEARATQPRFPQTYCSQCGASLGPGNEGVSHCGDHK